MLGKKVKSRIVLFVTFFLLISFLIYAIIKSLEENVIYFLSPTDIKNSENISLDSKVRIGGLVKEGSVIKKNESMHFVVTDLKNEIIVTFSGSVPNLFSEGKGIVAEGKLQDRNYFIAEKILAKHDENYMPSEVYESLKIEASSEGLQ